MGQMMWAESFVILLIAGITGLARKGRRPVLRRVARTILSVLATTTTALLAASVALFVFLARDHADSPAGAVPLALAFLCAGVAIPAWIGFAFRGSEPLSMTPDAERGRSLEDEAR